MKSRRRLATLRPWTLLAVLAIGCDGTVTLTDPDGSVSFQTVLQSQISGIGARREQIIESRGEWSAVWSEIGRGGSPPAVDFDRDMIALVAAGSRPNGCYTIGIRSIDLRGGLLRIDADLNEPGDNCLCPAGIVQPVHAVRLRRISRRADFDVRRVVQDCR